jgi:hypothetical protein
MRGGYLAYLLERVLEWAESEGIEDIEAEPFFDYAIANNIPLRPPQTLKQQTIRDVQRALQKATYIDPQGNKVRARHAIRIDQMELPHMPPRFEYIDPRTTEPPKMEVSMDQSYEKIVNHVRRHAIEQQSFNLNTPYEGKVRDYDYDFRAVAEDARMTGTYKDDFDDDDFNDLD